MGSVGSKVSSAQSTMPQGIDYTKSASVDDAIVEFKQRHPEILIQNTFTDPKYMHPDNAKDILNRVERMIQDDDVEISSLQVRTDNRNWMASESGTLQGDVDLTFNGKYMKLSRNDLNDVYLRGVESGFHPNLGTLSAAEAVTAHELGHAMSDNYVNARVTQTYGEIQSMFSRGADEAYDQLSNPRSWRKSSWIRELVNDSIKAAGVKAKGGQQGIASTISGYAGKSPAECVAEAYADVSCNGDRANVLSKAIVNRLKSHLNAYK